MALTSDDLDNQQAADFEAPLAERSVGILALLFATLPIGLVGSLLGDSGVTFGVLLLGGLIAAWLMVLAVAAVTRPPTPLAETSILAERLAWCVRAAWAAVVIATSSLFSAMVALEVQDHPQDPAVWDRAILDSLSSFVGPVAGMAAFLASSSIPFQLWRAGTEVRAAAARRLVRPLRDSGLPSYWLERLIRESASPLCGFFVCYMGPPVAYAVATQIPGVLDVVAHSAWWQGLSQGS